MADNVESSGPASITVAGTAAGVTAISARNSNVKVTGLVYDPQMLEHKHPCEYVRVASLGRIH